MAKKYYAVKIGRIPGIYDQWEKCKTQVHGFPGAIYKSFTNQAEAETFISGPSRSEKKLDENLKDTKFHIYVDGSYSDKKYGWGFAVYQGNQLVYQACGRGENETAAKLHNVAGELEAVEQAVLWAEQNDISPVRIFHDYTGIAEWAEGRWKTNNEITQSYAAFMQKRLSWVVFQKVSGHTGVTGNELADQLAKSAIGLK